MSSILTALQKLESETLEKGAGQSWLHHVTAKKKSLEKKERIRGKYRFALLCVSLVILGSAAFVFLKTEPAAIPSVSEPQPVPGTGNLVKKNESARAEIRADKAIGTTGADKITVKSSRPPEIGISSEDDVPLKKATLNGVNEGGGRESTLTDGPVVLRDTKKSVQANPEESGLNTGRKALDEPPDTIVAKRIQNSDLKLHAISWTSDVKTRIAVINGSIVREGDTVSSYQVYKINTDDIVLSKGGEFWRLAFRGR